MKSVKQLTAMNRLKVASFAAAVLSVLLLFSVFSQPEVLPENLNLKVIGQVSGRNGDARRRSSLGVAWVGLYQTDDIYNQDSLFTSEAADLKVDLEHNGKLTVEPSSLLQVSLRKATAESSSQDVTQNHFDLQYGRFQYQHSDDSPVLLTMADKSYTITGKQYEIGVTHDHRQGDVKIQVVHGEIHVGQTTVKENEVYSVALGHMEVQHPSLQILEPVSSQRLWTSTGDKIHFAWKPVASPSEPQILKLELASDWAFEHPVLSTPVTGTSFDAPIDGLPEGNVYWRLISESGESVSGRASRFAFFSDIPPRPLFPNDHQSLYSKDAEGGTSPLLAWEDLAGSSSWVIQLAHDAEFKSLIFEHKTNVPSEMAQGLPPGSYFWRVMGLNSERKSPPWSMLSSFTVQNGHDALPAPQMASTQLTYSIPESLLSKKTNINFEKQSFNVSGVAPFSWSPVDGAAKYEVEISANENFDPSQRFETGTATSFALSEIHYGSYYVRVRAVNPAGVLSSPSEASHLDVFLPAPRAKAPYVAKVDPTVKGKHHHVFDLTWTKLPFAQAYEVQWGSDVDFTQEKKFVTKTPQRQISVTKPMDYAFRVRALKADGTPLTAYSETEIAAFRYRSAGSKEASVHNAGKKSSQMRRASNESAKALAPVSEAATESRREPSAVLPTLSLLKPERTAQVMMPETAGFSIFFKWTAVAGADGYEIQFAQDADFVNMVGDEKTKSSSLNYTERFQEGRVFWRVRAHSRAGYSEWSETSDFNVIEE